ncbi:hypothetical protein G9A89_003501 [Geosiphon pyriformis]|nr:hypothetical protein G9A89_003501 [Geosiphon pyriformis]
MIIIKSLKSFTIALLSFSQVLIINAQKFSQLVVDIPKSSTWVSCSENSTSYIDYSIKALNDRNSTSSSFTSTSDQIYPLSPSPSSSSSSSSIAEGIEGKVAEKSEIEKFLDGNEFTQFQDINCTLPVGSTETCQKSKTFPDNTPKMKLCLLVVNSNDKSALVEISLNFQQQQNDKLILSASTESDSSNSTTTSNPTVSSKVTQNSSIESTLADSSSTIITNIPSPLSSQSSNPSAAQQNQGNAIGEHHGSLMAFFLLLLFSFAII